MVSKQELALVMENIENAAKSEMVCIVGVGFVGLTLGMSLCKVGKNVLGWEKDIQTSKALSEGKTEISEPGLSKLLFDFTKLGNFKMISDAKDASIARVFIITVGTPLREGRINLDYITEATLQILPALKDGDLIIIRSTTAVGTCREVVLPILEASGKKFRLAMCPERTVEGSALSEMSSLPQIIGSLNSESFKAAKEFFDLLGPEVVEVSSLEAAELTKLINNTYRDLMFGYANEIASISNAYGISAREVITAANHNYPRSNIALPGLSGGPCLEKDPWILVETGNRVGLSMGISKASREINEETLSIFLKSHLRKGQEFSKISILGLAFKGLPETRDLRGSYIFPLVDYLNDYFPGSDLHGYEPSGIETIVNLDLKIHTNLDSCLSDSELIIVLTNSLAFNNISFQVSTLSDANCLILDFWSRNTAMNFLDGQKYISWSGRVK